jgi:DNA-directed RNA polymerase subunit A'
MENPAVMMAKSGARGNMLNLSQMAGSIGQQSVRGERLHRGYTDRTLPHFKKGDMGAEAHGFVTTSYKSGLTPTEFFFHCMGGREGLVDTAARTSRSGYMQRRLINALEDLKVDEDKTVKNTADTIIQFLYGEDDIDPAKSVQGDAVDINAVIKEILGEEHHAFVEMEEKQNMEKIKGYGERELDEGVVETTDDEEELDTESEGPGGFDESDDYGGA